VEKGYENKPKFRGGDLFMVYLGFKNIVLPKIKWQALKNHLHFHIILESTEYFEKLSMLTILFWGALYVYEKLSSFTILACMIKVKKKLQFFL